MKRFDDNDWLAVFAIVFALISMACGLASGHAEHHHRSIEEYVGG